MEEFELYCLTDRTFFDRPDAAADPEQHFRAAGRSVPAGWDHGSDDTWLHLSPPDPGLPPQGWKIHVSSRLDDADRAIDAVWDYCVPRRLAFKFLRSRTVMVMLNSKAAPRGSSGKLMTIYPADVDQLELVLKDLAEVLAGVAGPYVLSDLRYGDGPLYVRYGGFVERHCLDPSGARVLALADADGRLVPDVRGPTFALPPWIELPSFLEPHLAARNAVTTTGLPYEIESVLQFSNGGGVYLGRDKRSGAQVVLKEGRPHAGLDVLGRDAVTRLGHERDILQRLAGLDVVPALLDHFTLGEHHFLVTEYVDAELLQHELVQRFPHSHPDRSPAELAAYVEWALETAGRVERAVEALHGRGVVFGDLHPSNILVTPDRLVLVDFEVATLAEDATRSALAHPAFAAPADRRGCDVDRYALACLRLGLFAPQATIMLPLHQPKVDHIAALVADRFPVPDGALDGAVSVIRGSGPAEDDPLTALPLPGTAGWERVRDAMSRAILAAATPERDDRLFPGDIAQFASPGGGIDLAHGAAGVLHALAVSGAGRFPEHEDWLRERARRGGAWIRPGFYDGGHGVDYVLDGLGYRQDALDTVEVTLRAPSDGEDLGLHSGFAGVGLGLMHLADRTGETRLAELAQRVVDLTADRLGDADAEHPRAGLMFGSSGPALLFLHAYEHSGDAALLDLAGVALRQDLRHCVRTADGTHQVDQGWRTLPYLGEGSVGIALVLDRYLAHRPDDPLAEVLDPLLAVTRCRYYVQSPLFAGRAGMVAAAGMLGLDSADQLVGDLALHALPHAGGLAFPGDQLLRLSMDLATGTAGVLLALATVLHAEPVALPFLHPSTSRTTGRTPLDTRKEV